MFAWLKTRNDEQARAAALHAAIVEEARAPHLYAAIGVPDTLDGRLELLALHMVLVVERLNKAGEPGKTLARAVTEAYVVAMDDTMRAIGVGDLTVPRKVKKAAAKLYDRHGTYAPALSGDQGDTADGWRAALTSAFAEAGNATVIDYAALAHYAMSRRSSLAAVPDAIILTGRLA